MFGSVRHCRLSSCAETAQVYPPLLFHHLSSCQHSEKANNVSQVLRKYIWPCKLPTGTWWIPPQGSVGHTFYSYCVDRITVNLYKAPNRCQAWLYALIILTLKCTDIQRVYYIPETWVLFHLLTLAHLHCSAAGSWE